MINISEACRKMGVYRQHYFDIKNTLAEEGIEGLMEKTRRVARIKNRFSLEIEEAILAYSLQFPIHSQVILTNKLYHYKLSNWFFC